MTGVAVFERTLQKANIWLKDIGLELGVDNKEQCLVYLRAVLHALRDRLPLAEAVDLAAQLPIILRGIYFEGWVPLNGSSRERTQEDFLHTVGRNLGPAIGFDLDVEAVTRAVLAVLSRHVSEGEMLDVLHGLPRQLRPLFQEWDNNLEARL